ncbi:hypothetical protein F5Y14DRAFT_457338 [Nemania sp. NC0429]|nr:hypothetical protein F5Y14DRAFT_457338 [Nemania sp. NC0429]
MSLDARKHIRVRLIGHRLMIARLFSSFLIGQLTTARNYARVVTTFKDREKASALHEEVNEGLESNNLKLYSGYIPDGYDAADRHHIYHEESNDMQSANLLTAMRGAFVTDLVPTGSGAVDIVTAATRFLAFRVKDSQLTTKPSRRFLYYNGRALALMNRHEEGDPLVLPDAVQDQGVQIRYAAQVVSIFGAAAESTWPLAQQGLRGGSGQVAVSTNERPVDAAYVEAKAGPAIESNCVGTLRLLGIKQCLIEGYPVIFAFRFFWDTFQSIAATDADEGYPTIAVVPAERQLLGPDPSKGYSASVALIVGFEQEKQRVLVKSVSPEGQSSAPPSYFWKSYDWVTDIRATMDYWVLREARGKMEAPSASDLFDRQGGQHLDPVYTPAVTQQPALGLHGSIAIIWRTRTTPIPQNSIEIVWAGGDGSVNRYYTLQTQHQQEQRQLYQISGPVPAAGPGAIANISLDNSRIDVFWVGKDGSIQHAWSLSSSIDNGQPAWLFGAIAQAGSAMLGAGLAVSGRVSAGHYQLNAYWVGPQCSVQRACAANNVQVKWGEWEANLPAPATAFLGSYLTACPSDAEGCIKVLYITPKGTIRARRCYCTSVSDQEAYSGSLARTDSGIVLSSTTEAVWVSPNNALIPGNKDGVMARAISKPGYVLGGSPIGLAKSFDSDTWGEKLMVAFRAYHGSLTATTRYRIMVETTVDTGGGWDRVTAQGTLLRTVWAEADS